MADELAGQTDVERAMSLMRVAQKHANDFWRAGPGPQGRPHLEAALRAIGEAYDLFDAHDSMRLQAGVLYGVLLAWKNALGAATGDERDRAAALLEESVDAPGLPVMQSATGRVMLGQLYLERAMSSLQDQSMLLKVMIGGGAPAATLRDLDRASECFHAVLESSMNAEMTNVATMMLKVADMFRGLLGGKGPQFGGLDLTGLSSFLTDLQGMQSRGFGMGISMQDMMAATEGLINIDPLDRPVPVVHGPESEETFEAPERPTFSVDVGELRRELEALSGVAGEDYEPLIEVLQSERLPAWIDRFLSLATRIVDGAERALGTDYLMLTAALILRSRRDGDSGWADDQGAELDTDLEAALGSLLIAAGTVPADQPFAMALMLQLAVLLPNGALDRLSSRLDRLVSAGRTLGAGAMLFGPDAALPWLDAHTGLLTPAVDPCRAQHVIVFGDDAQGFGDDQAVTLLASTAQLLDLEKRTPRSITEKVVFVANPRGDRESAAVDALLLRRSFYPQSIGLGRLVENADAAGTAAEVRAALDASLLHLACGVSAEGELELAESSLLDLATLGDVPGGRVILPPGAFLPLADRLIEAGATGVIGWRHTVPERTAALMLFVLHTELAENGCGPAAAVRAVRRWTRHPDLDRLPQLLAGHAARPESLREEDWAALVYRGR